MFRVPFTKNKRISKFPLSALPLKGFYLLNRNKQMFEMFTKYVIMAHVLTNNTKSKY